MGVSRRSNRRYSSREEAIEHEITEPVRQKIMKQLSEGGYDTAVMYRSVDSIADEVLRDERGGYARRVGEQKFWDIVGANIMIQTNNPAIQEEIAREKELMLSAPSKEIGNVESELWPIGTALVCGIFWYICIYICAVTGNI